MSNTPEWCSTPFSNNRAVELKLLKFRAHIVIEKITIDPFDLAVFLYWLNAAFEALNSKKPPMP